MFMRSHLPKMSKKGSKKEKGQKTQWNDRNDIYCFAISFQRRTSLPRSHSLKVIKELQHRR